MTTIWKFPFTSDHQKLEMPKGAQVLTVQMQGGQPCLWALVDTTAKKESRTFEVIGTGEPILTEANTERLYVSTVQDRAFVWHVFELCQP